MSDASSSCLEQVKKRNEIRDFPFFFFLFILLCAAAAAAKKKNLTGPRSFIPSNSMIINVLSPNTIIEIEERTERKKMSWKGTKVRGKEER